jgi:hypothetical protein
MTPPWVFAHIVWTCCGTILNSIWSPRRTSSLFEQVIWTLRLSSIYPASGWCLTNLYGSTTSTQHVLPAAPSESSSMVAVTFTSSSIGSAETLQGASGSTEVTNAMTSSNRARIYSLFFAIRAEALGQMSVIRFSRNSDSDANTRASSEATWMHHYDRQIQI